jgi:hypothetical protein
LVVVVVQVGLYIKEHFRLLEALVYRYLSEQEQGMSLVLIRLLDNPELTQHLVL